MGLAAYIKITVGETWKDRKWTCRQEMGIIVPQQRRIAGEAVE